MNRKLRWAIVICITVILTAVSAFSVSAGPVVLKDKDHPENETKLDDAESGQAVRRDRSTQDGTLIYGMTPVYPEDFREGTYDAEALSSSQFFKITGVKLTNEGGRIDAVITLSSTSYAYVYPGTAADAAAADPSEWIPADESSGYGEFRLEAEALNKEMPCAAYSKKKEKWYDRDIVFLASSLPADAILIDMDSSGSTIEDTQDAAMKVIYIALAIIIAGGILNHFIKKRYYE